MPEIMLPLLNNASQMSTYEELYREYLDNRVLIFNGDVDDSVIDDLILYILKWNKEDQDIPVEKRRKIKIYISSAGGNIFDANILVDVIMQSITPVVGIGLDMVASAAYIIYLACHERYAFKNTCLLQHEGDMSIENSRSKFKQTAQFFETMEKRSKEFVLERTNMTEEFYDNVYENEFWFYPDTGKDLGVVHKIIGIDCDLNEIL